MADEQTQTQYWSAGTGRMFLTGQANVSASYELNDPQKQAVAEAFGLWDDVSGFTAIEAVDDDHLARDATTYISYGPFGYVWSTSLTNDWTRVVLGDVPDGTEAGVNQAYGDHLRYHEIFISADPDKNPGVDTFAVGSAAFAVLVHEVGHSVFGNIPHPDEGADKAHRLPPTQAIMSWVRQDIGGTYASTPMPLDIDAAIANDRFGAATTRTGDDTYGFNAHFSGAYRSALDFTVNTDPLITIYDSGGFDTLDLSGAESLFDGGVGGVHIDLNPGAASYWIKYGDPFAIIYKTTEIEKAVGGSGNDEIFGNYLQNFVYGGAGDDTIFGGDGNDFLYGEGDNDTLNGGRGDDVMNGGTGNDNFAVDDPGDEVYEWAGDAGGRDKIYTTLNSYDLRPYGKGVWVEELQFVGNGNFVGIGNNLDNAVVGAAGDDWLYGNEGKDGLFGDQGSDHLFGGTEDDWLKSDAGNDFLYGDSGNDTLDGGADADEMHGGTGNDLYIVDNAGDQVIEEPNYRFLDFGFGPMILPWGGVDTVQTTLTATALSPNVENLTFLDDGLDLLLLPLGIIIPPTAHVGQGNELDNTIVGSRGVDTLYGNGGKDILDGGAGADFLYGGADNDTYYVDNTNDAVSEGVFHPSTGTTSDAGGTDQVYASTTFALGQWVENLTLTGTAILGLGNDIANTIIGNDQNNLLFGLGDADVLDGKAGADTMFGGDGNDIYYVDNSGDTEVEGNGVASGMDLVYSSARSHTLGDNVENLTLLAFSISGGIYGTGNASANVITGNARSNTLSGMDNSDTLIGEGGSDTLYGGTGNDTLYGGYVLRGEATGPDGDDTLYGDDGNDLIEVLWGNDRVHGGADNDTLSFAQVTANLTLDLAAGRTTYVESGSYQTATGGSAWVGQYTVTWDGIENLTGGVGSDTLTGDSGNNNLDGGGGQDYVVLHGKQSDYQVVRLSNGRVSVADSVAGRDGTDLLTNVEVLRFTDGDVATSTLAPNAIPRVAAANVTATHNQVFPVATLFTVSDANNDVMTAYQFWDSTADPASGHFVVNGPSQAAGGASGQLVIGTSQAAGVQPANVAIDVTAAQLAQTTFQSGSGSDLLWVRAFDGFEWSAWTSFTVTAPLDHAPAVTAQDPQVVAKNANLAVMSLFGTSDADGDSIVAYQFWDSTATATSGHFMVEGTAQGANQAIDVTPAQLASTTFQAGNSSVDDLWVRVNDGLVWSAWKEFHVSAPNKLPVVTAASFTASDPSYAASALFSASDPDPGDTITSYQLWDSTAAATSGYWVVSGVRQAANTAIDVSTGMLGATSFVTGTGSDQLWVRAFDGQDFGAWTPFTLTEPGPTAVANNVAPTVTVQDLAATRLQVFTGSQLVTGHDANGDNTITRYQFWDDHSAPGSADDNPAGDTSGYFLLNGHTLPEGTAIEVSAGQLGVLQFQTRSGTDLLWARAYDGFLWSIWQSFHITAPANHLPQVTAPGYQTVHNALIAATALFNVSDADNDSATQYQFWDSTSASASGHFVVNGQAQGAGQAIDVSAAQLAQTNFQAGTGIDQLWVRAFDGIDWSVWTSFTVTAQGNTPPTVVAADQTVAHGTTLAASTLFTASDADNDPIINYQFWDSTAAVNSGRFWIGGVAQGANVTIDVTTAQLASTTFESGSGSDQLWVRVNDGIDWSAWESITVTAPLNHAPAVAAQNSQLVAKNAAIAVSSLFTTSDADGDSIVAYQFWDATADLTSGHFVVNGLSQAAGMAIDMTAAQLASTTFQSGSGSDLLWARAFDGNDWGAWTSFTVRPESEIVGTEGNDVLTGTAGDDTIQALGGDDVLRGGPGADSLDGGPGRDILYVDNSDKAITGGADFDIVYGDASTVQNGFSFVLTGKNVEAVYGNDGNDVIDASALSDYQTMLFGANGDDVLIAGTNGSYTLNGGEGSDTVVIPGNRNDYMVDPNPAGWPGWMTVKDTAGTMTYWLQQVERLQFKDAIIDAPQLPVNQEGTSAADIITAGNGGEVLYGLDGNDRLVGGAGDDSLIGGLGSDQLIGGNGNDDLFIDNNDTLVDGGEGWDTVYVDDTQGAPAALHLTLAGTNVEFVYGGMGNDVFDASGVSTGIEMWGQWADDVLIGGSGDDTLLGDEWLIGGGNDILDGGAGNDWLDGGNGSDTFVFRAGCGLDTLYDFDQTQDATGTMVMAPEDHDVIRFEGGLFANFDALVASGAMAQVGANVVITLDATDQITLRNMSIGNLDAGDFVFAVTVNGTAGDDVITGDARAESINGLAGNDQINGGAGDDWLSGGDGNDILTGGPGADQLIGGPGTDFLWIDAQDTLIDGGDGLDYLYLDYTQPGQHFTVAGTHVEVVSGTLYDDVIDASGVTYGTVLFGNYGNDVLTGGAGNDSLQAAPGDDILDGGDGVDTAIYTGARSDYRITQRSDGSLLIADNRTGSPDGTDTVSNVEVFQFADKSYSPLDLLNTAVGANASVTNAGGTVGGTASATDPISIGAGETVEISSAFSGSVMFTAGTGTLRLDDPSSFSGTVAGMADQDTIDFANIPFAGNTTGAYSSAGGTLTVTEGSHRASVTLLGNYLASTFVASDDGHGGTSVVDPPALGGVQALMMTPHT